MTKLLSLIMHRASTVLRVDDLPNVGVLGSILGSGRFLERNGEHTRFP